MFTTSDRRRLNQVAMQRFSDIYPVPDRAIVLFTENAHLSINVLKPSQVADLMNDKTWLTRTAYYIFGAIEVSIWFSGHEVWREATKSEVISETSTLLPKNMPTATLERPATQAQPVPTIAPVFMPIDDIAAQMSAVTGRPIEAVKNELVANAPELFVSSTAATEMIDRQIEQLQAMRDLLAPLPVASVEKQVTTPQNGNQAPAAKPAATKPAAKKTTAKKSHAKKPVATKPAPEASTAS